MASSDYPLESGSIARTLSTGYKQVTGGQPRPQGRVVKPLMWGIASGGDHMEWNIIVAITGKHAPGPESVLTAEIRALRCVQRTHSIGCCLCAWCSERSPAPVSTELCSGSCGTTKRPGCGLGQVTYLSETRDPGALGECLKQEGDLPRALHRAVGKVIGESL